MHAYDIFISYRTAHGAWVETLANNLKTQGYNVFLDKWALIPGQDYIPKLDEALRGARCAVLVATPDTADSGWVQQEYQKMVQRKNSGSGFFFVPVIFGKFPDLPFLDTVQAVDFGDGSEAGYRKAFRKLLCGVRQESPGPDSPFDGGLTLPPWSGADDRELVQTETSFVMSLFDRMRRGLPQMVLAQDHTNMQIYGAALRKEAEAMFGADRVFHIYPPNSTRAEADEYFERLSRQCGFDAFKKSWRWADALKDRLADGKELFLLVTGFENGPDEPRHDLAGELRALHEKYPEFHLVMMGGERLAALKFADGSLSLLNIAQDVPVPEPNFTDLSIILSRICPDLDLSAAQMGEILTFTGGHPLLLHHCLEEKAEGATACEKHLKSSHLPGQLFVRFREGGDRELLCAYLQKNSLGPFELWPDDELLRRLYWRNLIANRQGVLCWRSEFIRNTGLEMLG